MARPLPKTTLTPTSAVALLTGPALADLTSTGGFVLERVEGIVTTPSGTGYVVTDNDAVDDHSGETMFFAIGAM